MQHLPCHTAAMKLQNKIAIITGGTLGIGIAIAKKMVEEGSQVVIVGFPALS
jgi:NAD(P)-dependent dehydrogenase (short-subunit alcohol dehydrogenase family)